MLQLVQDLLAKQIFLLCWERKYFLLKKVQHQDTYIHLYNLKKAGIDYTSDITQRFAGSHDGVIAGLYNGDAKFGVTYDDARRTLRKTNADVGEKVIAFAITEEIPNDVIAVRTDLPEDIKQQIYDDVMGGSLAVNKKVFQKVKAAEKITGLRLGPDDAYLITRGLRTLDVRLDRHRENAKKIAAFLSKNKKIKLLYPFKKIP